MGLVCAGAGVRRAASAGNAVKLFAGLSEVKLRPKRSAGSSLLSSRIRNFSA